MVLPDLAFVALFAVVGPLLDHALFWPAFQRRSRADPARARRWLWAVAIGMPWPLVAVGAVLWTAGDRSWTAFGFTVPDGWRLWTSIALFLLLAAYHVAAVTTLVRNAAARASLRQQVGPLAAVLPHTRGELVWFTAVALTAGFCEEFLYRGYFIGALSPWLGWWGAAALSLPLFALGHAYQGWNGVLRTGVVGAALTGAVAVFDSLWPAIALHALIDLCAGLMAWLALREAEPPADPDALRSA